MIFLAKVPVFQCVRKILFTGLLFGLFGCAIDLSITDRTQLTSQIDFSEAKNFAFDNDLIEFVDGEARLKPIVFSDSANQLGRGQSSGVDYQNGGLTLHASVTADSKNHQRYNLPQVLPQLQSALVGYWRFDGDFREASASSVDGNSVHGDTHISGDALLGSGTAMFDGVGDYLDIGDSEKYKIEGNFSIGFWVNHTDVSGYQAYVNREGEYEIVILDGRFQYAVANTSPGWIFVDTGFSPQPGEWYFVALTYDQSLSSNQLKFFVNGELIHQREGMGPIGDAHDDEDRLILGSRQAALDLYALKGALDEVFIVDDYVLSPSEVLEIYGASPLESRNTSFHPSWTPRYNNLVGYWSMDGQWLDESGSLNHGVREGVGDGSPEFITSSIAGSHSGIFDGLDDAVSFTNTGSLDLLQGSWGGWFRLGNNGPGAQRPLLVKSYSSHTSPYYDYHLFYIHTSQEVTCGGTVNGSWSQIRFQVSPLEDDGWRHLLCTYDGRRFSIYIDGEFVAGSAESVGVLTPTAGTPVTMGRYGNLSLASYAVGFEADEVAVWNVALSSGDVSKVFHRQKQKYAGHFDSRVFSTEGAPWNWPQLGWTSTLPLGKSLVPTSEESPGNYASVATNISEGLEGYWSFDEGSEDSVAGGADYADGTENNHHCDRVSGAHGVAGRMGFGLKGRAECGTGLSFAGRAIFSVSVWFKTSISGSGYFDIVTNRGTDAGGIQGWNCYVGGLTQNVQCRRTLDNLELGGPNQPGAADGRWHHIAFTYDGSTSRSYLDGELKTQDTDLREILGLSPVIALGDQSEDGVVDELGVWSRVLSESEVVHLYQRGANRGKFQVKTCVDSSCACSALSVTPQGSSTDCDGDGVENGSDSDDVFAARFVGPGGDDSTYYSEHINRSPQDLDFQCALNVSDTDPAVCAPDEVMVFGKPQASSPLFSFDRYLNFVRPSASSYIQYRAYLEADDNNACQGAPCFPFIQSISFGVPDQDIYATTAPFVTTKTPIPYNSLTGVEIKGDSCTGFQLSADGETFLTWSSSQGIWVSAAPEDVGVSGEILNAHIDDFARLMGPGNVYARIFFKSTGEDTCRLSRLSIITSEFVD